MQADIQKAIIWKRLAAWILDLILLVVLTSCIMWGLTAVSQYDKYEQQFNESRKQYAAQYGLTEEEVSSVSVYMNLPEEKQEKVKEAEKAMGQDPVAVKEMIHQQVEQVKIERRVRVGEIMTSDMDDDAMDDDIR